MYSLYLSPCFFLTQTTAYDMRISDWSSDVCSSDLLVRPLPQHRADLRGGQARFRPRLAEPAGLPGARGDPRGARQESSEERRVGKECGSTCRSRGATNKTQTNKYIIHTQSHTRTRVIRIHDTT